MSMTWAELEGDGGHEVLQMWRAARRLRERFEEASARQLARLRAEEARLLLQAYEELLELQA